MMSVRGLAVLRKVLPEILDELPPDDPRAVRSRRDLVRINRVMGNESWVISALRDVPESARRKVVEIGAGEGHLAARILEKFPDSSVAAIDLMPDPEILQGIEWHQGDLFEMTSKLEGALVVANLFLHHFEADQLAQLGRLLRGSTGLIASEPERRALHVWQGKLISPFIGDVTRHDLKVSVGAGFCGEELPALLGLQDDWKWSYLRTWTGAHRVTGVPK